MKDRNVLLNKSKAFAVRIIRLSVYLNEKKREYVMAKQLLRSGTSIGANVREAVVSMSKPEFVAKLNISLKEANETAYWLELLHETNFLTEEEFESVYADCEEVIKLLTAIIKTTNENIKQQKNN